MSDIKLTWDEVLARSEVGGIYCADCRMNYDLVQMPCHRHCASDAERKERDSRFEPKFRAEIRLMARMMGDDDGRE